MRIFDVVLRGAKRNRGQATLPQVMRDLWERGLPAMTVDRSSLIPAFYVRQILRCQTAEETLEVGQETVGNFVTAVAGNRRGMG